MKIKSLFEAKRARSEKTFVAYITAGDPTVNDTVRTAETLVRSGVDILELGVPHTDPVADGVTNMRAAERALSNGGGLSQTLEIVGMIRSRGVQIPIVLFTYYNPIARMGIHEFSAACRSVEVDGVLVVDLPPEEASVYCEVLRAQEIATIFLASPTTSRDRLKMIASCSTGFVYYVSRGGVTGVREDLPVALQNEIQRLRQEISNPICIGFGISTPEQVAIASKLSDGVVVGSALVRRIEAGQELAEFTKELVRAC